MSRGNETEPLPLCKEHDEVHRLQLAWYGAVLGLGLPLNAIALWVFLKVFRLRTVVTIYMTNLAVCDLFVTLALPLRIYYHVNDVWNLGNVPCRLAGSFFLLNMYGSCLFLAAINVDRLLALVYPLRSRPFRRPRVAWMVCGAVWALVVVGSVPMALAHDTSRCQVANSSEEEGHCFVSFSTTTWNEKLLPLVVPAVILGFLLPLVAVLYCSIRILFVLRTGWEGGEGARRRYKARFLLLVNAGIFVLCFLPFNLLLVIYTTLEVDGGDQQFKDTISIALELSILLSSSNCCLDPLIYYFSTEGFRATFRGGGAPTLLSPASPSRSQPGRWCFLASKKGRRRTGGGDRPGSPPGEGEGGQMVLGEVGTGVEDGVGQGTGEECL
ncbi:LOW QUALITY PROTEIN: lysophosphatidic acid receptor 5-like [Leucoraja erinacea]|uniref:LOW QUALITY PROTEIN: lysophosphatidic acid receptor 5-like n=1 Tax=Leucoraja erinaceus TaxID=7782 RepID=UPI0024538B33|nr:LOW QUALITY PROTEIN: lysophosphatidic acid receptor 5-like [Leucoraja erinacea]